MNRTAITWQVVDGSAAHRYISGAVTAARPPAGHVISISVRCYTDVVDCYLSEAPTVTGPTTCCLQSLTSVPEPPPAPYCLRLGIARPETVVVPAAARLAMQYTIDLATVERHHLPAESAVCSECDPGLSMV
eukprot:scaffold142013_cov38-Prasinocladus_malaysianus.AAC.2